HAIPTDQLSFLAIAPVTPTTRYPAAASCGYGVLKSTNGGGSWSAVNPGLSDLHVYGLAIDPQTPSTLYAGTRGGVFKSTDGGGSWFTANNDLPTAPVTALAIDPQTPAILYAGTGGLGPFGSRDVLRSTNGGASRSVGN